MNAAKLPIRPIETHTTKSRRFMWAYVALVYLFLYLPIIVLAIYSFNTSLQRKLGRFHFRLVRTSWSE